MDDTRQGTGRGLSQVFEFARQHGGHAALRSTPGHGAAITLYLPELAAIPLKEAE